MARVFLGRAVLAAAAALAGCRAEPPAARHVVLVTIDTLRADHLGAYGADVATPHLDRLAAQGALAVEASAHVPLTRPSHLNLMSGRLPPETGVRDNLSPGMPPAEQPLLAEILRAAGFRTAGFVSAVVLSRAASGLDRGFAEYGDAFPLADAEAASPRLASAEKRGDQTLAEATAWLEREARGAPPPRLFLWLHLYDPHDPYAPPEPWATRYRERPYAGEVAWSDELVGRLDTVLVRLGLAEDALLVVTSDHGEGLGEHDELLHGFFAYQSTLRVPLLLRGPGIAPGRRLENVVGLVDLLPTILDLAGVPPPAGAELSGRSLAAALRGGEEPPPLPLYAETLVPRLHFGWSDLRVVRDGRWKYIAAPRPELYDLASDPDEARNLLAEERRRVHALRAALEGFLAREHQAGTASAPPLAPELLEQLAALGYLGGAAPAETATPGADPKDKIGEFRLANDLMRRGLGRLGAGDHQGSVTAFAELLERGIDSAELRLYLGRSLLGLRRFEEAGGHFLEATARLPTHPGGWLGLAEALAQTGAAEEAVSALRAGQRALPREAKLRREEARLLRTLGRAAEAERALEAWLAADPPAPEAAFAHAALAELRRGGGDLEGAVAHLRQAVALAAGEASYWNALGMTLGAAGRLAEAEPAFREARRLDAGNALYAYNLGLALERDGRRAEAADLFREALALDPDFAPARARLR